jgi:hypothetical protein
VIAAIVVTVAVVLRGGRRLLGGLDFGLLVVLVRGFPLAFPVVRINSLREKPKLGERVGFTNTTNFILDASRESSVELAVESAITITLDLRGETLKVDNVLVNTLPVS